MFSTAAGNQYHPWSSQILTAVPLLNSEEKPHINIQHKYTNKYTIQIYNVKKSAAQWSQYTLYKHIDKTSSWENGYTAYIKKDLSVTLKANTVL
jgi:hypothetical protein